MSHFIPATTLAVSTSKHQWLENLGPPVSAGPYFDVHNNEQLCWGYTMIMVLVQILAYGRVSDERDRKRSARAAVKAARERKIALEEDMTREEERISLESLAPVMNGHAAEHALTGLTPNKNVMKELVNGQSLPTRSNGKAVNGKLETYHIEESTPEPSSEEETIV